MDETEAIAQMKAGNIAALRTLMEMYQVQAVQAAALITQNRAAAEDIVQNAFLRSYERAELFDPSRPFRPWFLRMMINDALKAAARQRRHISLDAQDDGCRVQKPYPASFAVGIVVLPNVLGLMSGCRMPGRLGIFGDIDVAR